MHTYIRIVHSVNKQELLTRTNALFVALSVFIDEYYRLPIHLVNPEIVPPTASDRARPHVYIFLHVCMYICMYERLHELILCARSI